MKKLILIAAPLCLATLASAQISFTGATLTENFDNLATSGTSNAWANNTTIVGWYSDRTTYRASTGSDNAGALYSFGAALTNPLTERALGSIGSGSATPFYGVAITNNTGANILDFTVSYTGEQWRRAANASAHTLTFGYKVNAATISEAGYTGEAALNFVTPITGTTTATSLDGNSVANRLALSSTITFTTPLANGQTLWLRWSDINETGDDHALAIDDFSFSATTEVVPEPATMTILAGAASMAAMRRRKK
jgi:uncharacterized protein